MLLEDSAHGINGLPVGWRPLMVMVRPWSGAGIPRSSRNTPIEAIELIHPRIGMRHYKLVQDSGGAGELRDGWVSRAVSRCRGQCRAGLPLRPLCISAAWREWRRGSARHDKTAERR